MSSLWTRHSKLKKIEQNSSEIYQNCLVKSCTQIIRVSFFVSAVVSTSSDTDEQDFSYRTDNEVQINCYIIQSSMLFAVV